MNVLKARYELIRQQQHRLERKPSAAVVQEILQIWAEKLKRHHPEFTFPSIPVYPRDAEPIGKLFVDADFVLEERRIYLIILEFQGDFLFSLDIVPLGPVSLTSRRHDSFTDLDKLRRMIRDLAGGLIGTYL